MAIVPVDPTLPVATTFVNRLGKSLKFYLRNNPWKVAYDDCLHKTFRYCVICGEARFSVEEWSTVARMKFWTGTVCNKKKCMKISHTIDSFIPKHHWLNFIEPDRSHTQGEGGQVFFEEVKDVTHLRDGFFSNSIGEEGFPPLYNETLERLELTIKEFPTGAEKLSEIYAIYHEYARKNNLPLGKI